MIRGDRYEEFNFRDGIVRILDAVKDCILYFKWYRPLQKEKDPKQRLERELLIELLGVRLGGMTSNGAYVSFKRDYYDRLASDKEKCEVRKALLRMLRYGRYSVSHKVIMALACSDLRMDEAAADIALVREASARNMSMKQLHRFNRERERELRKHSLADSLDRL